MWRKYYEKWPQVTLEREGPALVELHPAWLNWSLQPRCWTSTSIRPGRRAGWTGSLAVPELTR